MREVYKIGTYGSLAPVLRVICFPRDILAEVAQRAGGSIERESNREDGEEKKQGEKQGRERNEVIKGQAGMASWRGTRLG